jgi:hypothetical protein
MTGHRIRIPGFRVDRKTGKPVQMPPAEVGDGAQVGRVCGHDHHEVRALGARFGDAARGVEAAHVAVQQQRRHHQRQRPQRVAELTAEMEAAERRDALWRSWSERRKGALPQRA